MKTRVAGASAGLLALVAATPAIGCGHCVEDKVAAVYDHGLIMKALGEHHQVVFFGIEGNFSGR